MTETIVLFEPEPTGRGTTSAINNFAKCLELRGYRVLKTFLGSGFSREKGESEVTYISDLSEAGQMELERLGCTIFYNLVAGDYGTNFVEPSFLVINHVVFPILAPLDGLSVYVSQWLAESGVNPKNMMAWSMRALLNSDGRASWRSASATVFKKRDWLPHVVDPIEKTMGLRSSLGIPESAKVISSLSHPSQFDLNWVVEGTARLVRECEDVYFLGAHLNSKSHPRIISDFEYDQSQLPALLGAIDLAVFGRKMGESFGMGVAEALSAGVPVLAWQGGRDKNHILMLRDSDFLYRSSQDFLDKARFLLSNPPSSRRLEEKVQGFDCSSVFDKFELLVAERRRSLSS